MGPAQVALHQLRLRGDHGRDPDRPRRDGRDTIVKIFGSYHGHHDYVMVSIGVEYDKIGTATTTSRSRTAPASCRPSQT